MKRQRYNIQLFALDQESEVKKACEDLEAMGWIVELTQGYVVRTKYPVRKIKTKRKFTRNRVSKLDHITQRNRVGNLPYRSLKENK